MSILIRGATILTQDEHRTVMQGDLYIEDGRIAELSPRISTEAEYVITGERLVMPGLVNMHTHLPMVLMRGYGDDLPLERWLQERIWPIEGQLTEQLVRAGTRLAVLEMIAGGTTCLADMYFFEDAIAEVCSEMGIRAYPGFSIIDFDTAEMTSDEMLPACERFIRKWRDSDLVTPVVAPHSAYSCSGERLQASADLAQRYGVPLHTHCSETRQEVYDVEEQHGRRPLSQLAEHGMLTGRTMLAHCGWITKQEVRDIAESGAAVSHNPVSNMKLGTGGYTPLPELFDAGAPVTLGTDGAASNNTLSMLETMKYAALIHKQHRWDAAVVPAQQALDMATRNAARWLAIDSAIVEGAPADLAVLDLDLPGMQPLHDPVSQVVYAAGDSAVSSAIVKGRPLMLEREFVDIDARWILSEAKEAAMTLTAGQ
jgi:5-methylthioadenosine/S-adenosylhomocysteine deaminase